MVECFIYQPDQEKLSVERIEFMCTALTGRLLLRSKIHNLLITIPAMPPMNTDSKKLWQANITKL